MEEENHQLREVQWAQEERIVQDGVSGVQPGIHWPLEVY